MADRPKSQQSPSKPQPQNEPSEKPTRPPRVSKFQMINNTREDEDRYDIVTERKLAKPCSVFASVMHIVKGALGGGFLSGHVAFMKSGVGIAIPITILLGAYMTYTLHLLLLATQRLCRRTEVPSMSYPDVGEAAFTLFPKKGLAKIAKAFRYTIDATICLDLFGSCACYHIMIAKTAKQLVEDVQDSPIEGVGNYPHLRVYLISILIPLVLICLIPHLKWLAPFSMVANCLIILCLFVTIYYAFQNNPRCENLILAKTFSGALQMIGMIVFSISCAGVVIPIENNMKIPTQFPKAIMIGMSINTTIMIMISFFGYMGYLERSDTPLTVNFPMTVVPKMIKGFMAVMITITHALNFWAPFNLCWWYLKKLHKEEKQMKWELIYRAICVTVINIVAIVFPSITALMGFLGTFCLSNMAFIWPNLLFLLVIWERPGLGIYKWRLWGIILLLIFGVFLLVAGSLVNIEELVSVFVEVNIKK